MLSGRVRLAAERLTDMLNEHDELQLVDVDGPAPRRTRGRSRSREVLVRARRDPVLSTRPARAANRAAAAGRGSTRVAMQGRSVPGPRLSPRPSRVADRSPAIRQPAADGAADRRLDRVRRRRDPAAASASARSSSTATTSTGSSRGRGEARPRRVHVRVRAELAKGRYRRTRRLDRARPRRLRTSPARRYHRRMPRPHSPPAGPLAGLRVIDLSTVLAGPYATMVLADLGADVVKVEPPEGDATRGWGPPWVGDDDGRDPDRRLLPGGQPQQALDPARPPPAATGPSVLRRLLADADVLVENLRPGSLARLGFDEDALRALNPRPRPPRDQRLRARRARPPTGPGYDFVIQAVGGLMSITGDADADGGHPDQGRRGDQRRRDGPVRAIGILAGLLASAPRRPDARPAHRRLAARRRRWPCWSTRPRTPS